MDARQHANTLSHTYIAFDLVTDVYHAVSDCFSGDVGQI